MPLGKSEKLGLGALAVAGVAAYLLFFNKPQDSGIFADGGGAGGGSGSGSGVGATGPFGGGPFPGTGGGFTPGPGGTLIPGSFNFDPTTGGGIPPGGYPGPGSAQGPTPSNPPNLLGVPQTPNSQDIPHPIFSRTVFSSVTDFLNSQGIKTQLGQSPGELRPSIGPSTPQAQAASRDQIVQALQAPPGGGLQPYLSAGYNSVVKIFTATAPPKPRRIGDVTTNR